MHLTGTFVSNILHRSIKEIREYIDINTAQIEGIIRISRLWGLIHDIGHGPFSHAFEYYVLFEREFDHETIVPEIYKADLDFKKKIDDFVNFNKYFYGDTLSTELILDFFREDGSQIELKEHELLFIVSKLIKGEIYSIDEIDYILRDSHFCGTPEYGTIDWKRLMYLSWIIKSKITDQFKLILEEKALQSLVDYYWAKYFMYNAVYFHNRCHAVEKYLREIFLFMKDRGDFNDCIDNLENYHILDDYFILNALLKGKQSTTSSTIKGLYNTHYEHLVDLYNFEVPFTFIGKSKNEDISTLLKYTPKRDKIAKEEEVQEKFSESLTEVFDRKIHELRMQGDKQIQVEILENNYDYIDDIFFHHIRICANERFFLDFKAQYDYYLMSDEEIETGEFYMLDEKMDEKDYGEIYNELIGKIPTDENEAKILISNILYKILIDDFPELFDKILNSYNLIDI